MKPHVRKGGRADQLTYYIRIPKEFVKSLNISPNDQFTAELEQKDGEIVIMYKRERKSSIPI